jgi:hypothetical protein
MDRRSRKAANRNQGQTPFTPSRTEPSGSEGAADSSAIAQRAYRRFEERGYEHGHDVEDWLEAEQELRQPSKGE